ncbi:hypothetical protein TARUN_9439 [Trichoderma arundinaceum]|uniref:Uncharacterized protein n=1 Tax=Trichoderma arundinaceum TaxID=490622 RepID=A0A395N9L4_TRIAR|nr:hypothetical protein TARUN_9439 [Trichoderma arundinaceum]
MASIEIYSTSLLILVPQPSGRLLPGRRPPSRGLHRNDKQPQHRGRSPHAPDGVGVSVDGNLPHARLQRVAVPHELRRPEQPVDERPPGGAELGRAVEGEEPADEAGAQDAVEDAAAEGGAEAAAEAAERGQQAGGDVLGAGVAEVQEVDEGVVERDARGDAVEDDGGDEGVGLGGRARYGGQGVDRAVDAQDGQELREVVRACAADVRPPDDEAAEGEADVCGDEDGAGGGWGGAADGEHEDGGVEEDAPAGGEEAELGEAGEEDAAGGEHGEGDDGLGGEAVLGGDEGDEGEEREDEGDGMDVSCEGVEEEDDGEGLECVC